MSFQNAGDFLSNPDKIVITVNGAVWEAASIKSAMYGRNAYYIDKENSKIYFYKDKMEGNNTITIQNEGYDPLTLNVSLSNGNFDVSSSGSDPTPTPTPSASYLIIEGNYGKWTKGMSDGLAMTANGDFVKFRSVVVDGMTVDPANYTAVSGGTVVTFVSAYLESLTVGEHTVDIVYSDGKASGKFTVLAAQNAEPGNSDDTVGPQEPAQPSKPSKPGDQKPTSSITPAGTDVNPQKQQSARTGDSTAASDAPQTGDASELVLWLSLLLLAGGATVTVYAKKKKARD